MKGLAQAAEQRKDFKARETRSREEKTGAVVGLVIAERDGKI